MKKTQQGAAVAVVTIGLIIVAIGAGTPVNELREERRERARLEREAVQLRHEVERLKPRIVDFDGDGDLDIYVIQQIQPGVTVFQNQGDGTFTDVQVQRSKKGTP